VKKGMVLNIQHYSLHDGPGIRTTVFLKGCPLTCLWCHNPESIRRDKQKSFSKHRCIFCGECGEFKELSEHCPTGALETLGKEMTVSEVLGEIVKDTVFFDESGGGVTFSGGEPLLQWEFVYAVAKVCKQQGIHTALDTSGYGKWEPLQKLGEVIDLFLYDLKHFDDDRHRELTGVSNQRILNNLKKLTEFEEKIVVRIPVIPGLNDDKDHLASLKEWIASIGLKQVMLLPYHKTGIDKYLRIPGEYQIPEVLEPKEETMEKIKQEFEKAGLTVTIGG
jgi:pyruvate formate lyase activating enzyme